MSLRVYFRILLALNLSTGRWNVFKVAQNTLTKLQNKHTIAHNTLTMAQNTSIMAQNSHTIPHNMSKNMSTMEQNMSTMAQNTSIMSHNMPKNMSKKAHNMSKMAQNTSPMVQNTSTIAQNTSIMSHNMPKNMSKKAQNTSPMVQNASVMAQNMHKIAHNMSKMAQNTSPMVQNTLTIAQNTSTMAQNTSKNMSPMVQNASVMAQNTLATTSIISTVAQNASQNSSTPAKPFVTPNCSSKPDGFKKISGSTVDKFNLSVIEIENENPSVKEGGQFKPSKCIANKVAILVPYRNRLKHLHRFLYFMHPVLQHQQLEYKIFVINQSNEGKFNRAKLLNIGFVEAIKDFDAKCFVFHDVDIILIDEGVTYSCSLPTPRHMTSFGKFYLFGGVTQLTKVEFTRVNGYSNRYWGWGGEDDDLYHRIRGSGLKLNTDKYAQQHYYRKIHNHDIGNEANPERLDLLKNATKFMHKDGLNTLKYKVISHEAYKLYTNITVNVVYGEAQLANETHHLSESLEGNLNYQLKIKK